MDKEAYNIVRGLEILSNYSEFPTTSFHHGYKIVTTIRPIDMASEQFDELIKLNWNIEPSTGFFFYEVGLVAH